MARVQKGADGAKTEADAKAASDSKAAGDAPESPGKEESDAEAAAKAVAQTEVEVEVPPEVESATVPQDTWRNETEKDIRISIPFGGSTRPQPVKIPPGAEITVAATYRLAIHNNCNGKLTLVNAAEGFDEMDEKIKVAGVQDPEAAAEEAAADE